MVRHSGTTVYVCDVCGAEKPEHLYEDIPAWGRPVGWAETYAEHACDIHAQLLRDFAHARKAWDDARAAAWAPLYRVAWVAIRAWEIENPPPRLATAEVTT